MPDVLSIKQIYEDNGLHLQQTGWTCGPAALLNVLAMHHQRLAAHGTTKGVVSPTPRITEEDLAEICETDPVSGTDNDMMVSAARAAGLEVVSVTTGATPEDIDRYLAIGHYVIINFRHAFDGDGHFAVVAESDDAAFYLRDSSLGLLRLKKRDLVEHWHNSDGTISGWLLALRFPSLREWRDQVAGRRRS